MQKVGMNFDRPKKGWKQWFCLCYKVQHPLGARKPEIFAACSPFVLNNQYKNVQKLSGCTSRLNLDLDGTWVCLEHTRTRTLHTWCKEQGWTCMSWWLALMCVYIWLSHHQIACADTLLIKLGQHQILRVIPESPSAQRFAKFVFGRHTPSILDTSTSHVAEEPPAMLLTLERVCKVKACLVVNWFFYVPDLHESSQLVAYDSLTTGVAVVIAGAGCDLGCCSRFYCCWPECLTNLSSLSTQTAKSGESCWTGCWFGMKGYSIIFVAPSVQVFCLLLFVFNLAQQVWVHHSTATSPLLLYTFWEKYQHWSGGNS